MMTASSKPPIGYELNRFLQVKRGTELLKEDGTIDFPWLVDTLRFGKVPETWTAAERISVMNHLLVLLAQIENASGRDLDGLQHAWYCFEAAHDYHSQEYDFSPIIQQLQTTSDVRSIVWLIKVLEYTYSGKLYSRYIKPFDHHSNEDVLNAEWDARTRMKF